jgi:hypothetical protein
MQKVFACDLFYLMAVGLTKPKVFYKSIGVFLCYIFYCSSSMNSEKQLFWNSRKAICGIPVEFNLLWAGTKKQQPSY